MKHTIIPALVLATTALACGGANTSLPQELDELASRRDAGASAWIREQTTRTAGPELAATMREAARGQLSQAETYFGLASDAWEDKQPQRSVSYAQTGNLHMDAAESFALTAERSESRATNNAEIVAIEAEASDRLAELQEEEEMVAALESLQSIYESNARLRADMDALSIVQDARFAQTTALSMGADRYASEQFTQAVTLLEQAEAAYVAGDWDTTGAVGASANAAFAAAIEIARPTYEANYANLMRDEAVQNIFRRATALFERGVQLDARGVAVILTDAFDTGDIDMREARAYLVDLAAQLSNEFPEYTIAIEGHTDSRGGSSDNLALSSARAEVFRNLLTQKGVPIARTSSVGFGEERPAYDNRDAEGRRNNRRLEVVFLVN